MGCLETTTSKDILSQSWVKHFIVPTHIVGGRTIYSNVFFVRSNLANRYNRRIESRVVSLENSSSIEFKIKIF